MASAVIPSPVHPVDAMLRLAMHRLQSQATLTTQLVQQLTSSFRLSPIADKDYNPVLLRQRIATEMGAIERAQQIARQQLSITLDQFLDAIVEREALLDLRAAEMDVFAKELRLKSRRLALTAAAIASTSRHHFDPTRLSHISEEQLEDET